MASAAQQSARSESLYISAIIGALTHLIHVNGDLHMSLIPVGFILGGFLLSAAISERSLGAVDEAQQGRLLKGTAALRKIHFAGIPLLLLLTYFYPIAFWPGFTGYFACATCLVANRVSKLELPRKLQQWQIASVASIAIGAAFGWISASIY
jgi:cytochrome bd-type quinol oxidase subunit 1